MRDDNEIWKISLEFPRYEVSSYGRVRRIKTGLISKAACLDLDGYRLITLSPGHKCFRIARLVAMTFVPNPHGKPHVNHIDAVRTNDHASNLEWVTPAENILHSRRLGNISGEKLARARVRLTDEQVRMLRAPDMKFGDLRRLAEQFGINKKYASAIRMRQHYRWVEA